MGCCGSSGMNNDRVHEKHNGNLGTTEQLNLLDLLKIRLAKGELPFEEYEKIKAELMIKST